MKISSEKLPLSVVVIALNEELHIERLLKSVGWAQEIVIYDSGSTDQTIALAEKLGAKVIRGPWLGFGPSKKKATSFASFDWVLSLDADEEVSEKLKQELFQKWNSLDPQTAYQLPRLSKYLNCWIRHGGWYPDLQTRLFNRQFSNWNEAEIHEQVVCSQKEKFQNCFHHYVFKNIEHHIQTNNRYSSLLAEQMYKKGQKFSWFHWLTKPSVKFFECYFLKLGFLDGWVGYFIAKGAAYSVFLKWSKLKVLHDKNQSN